MPSLTLNQLASQLVLEQGEKRDDNGFISQMEIWIKDSIIEIDSLSQFKIFWKEFSFNTNTDQAIYDLPEDFKHVKYMRLVDTDDEINYINPKTLARYNIDLEQKSNRPFYYWVFDAQVQGVNVIKKLRVHPIPTGVISINMPYYFDITSLISSSVLPLSQQCLLALKSRVRMQMHKLDKEWDAFNAERSQYAIDIQNLISLEKSPPSRILINRPTDLPRRSSRPYRLRYPWE